MYNELLWKILTIDYRGVWATEEQVDMKQHLPKLNTKGKNKNNL